MRVAPAVLASLCGGTVAASSMGLSILEDRDMPITLPATGDILQVFTETITSARGTVLDVYDDGSRLFVRSTLTVRDEVRPGDSIRGGVALRTETHEVLVHPYTFRQVCRNGMIRAEASEARRIQRVPFSASSEDIERVLDEVREAVCECSAPETLKAATRQMRSAANVEADLALQLLPLLNRMSDVSEELVDMIWQQFEAGRDRSVFGMMNAVTATARDQSDPELRWRLEELGGGVLALRKPSRKPGGTRRAVLV